MGDFFSEVYKIVYQIPKGKVTTYGLIASMLGNPRGARIVGWAMKAAPEDLKLPCHRVVKKTGELSPAYVFGFNGIQKDILISEGITFLKNGNIDMGKHLWKGPFSYNYPVKDEIKKGSKSNRKVKLTS